MRRRFVVEDDDSPTYTAESVEVQNDCGELVEVVSQLGVRMRCVRCEGQGLLQGEPCYICEGSGWEIFDADELEPIQSVDPFDCRLPEAVLIAEVSGEDLGDD